MRPWVSVVLLALIIALEPHRLALAESIDGGYVDIVASLEEPFVKYYINITSNRERIFEVMAINTSLVCTAPSEVRLQLVAASSYIVRVDNGTKGILCASPSIEVANGSLAAYIYPVIIDGKQIQASWVYIPYYLVNIESMPNATRITMSGDRGYILGFNTSDVIYIKARIFPYPRELGREIPSQQHIQAPRGDAQSYDEILYILAYTAGGFALGFTANRIYSIARSRLRRRDLEREIIDLLSRSPKGLSLSQISKTLNTPKSSTWKKLKKLVEEGVVEEFEGPGRGKLYRLKRESSDE
jgi:hypothetical protein